MTPGNARTSDNSLFQCLEALGLHYRLNSSFGGFIDDSLTKDEMGNRWLRLSMALMADFVPAFKIRRRGGAPSWVQRRNSPAYPHAHAARLVQIVVASELC